MKAIKDLKLGFSDAQNYTQRKNKQMLAEVFVKNDYLERLLDSSVYYLIGEKGTGKTAYAAFLSNTDYGDAKSFLKFISGTDYEKFHELKNYPILKNLLFHQQKELSFFLLDSSKLKYH